MQRFPFLGASHTAYYRGVAMVARLVARNDILSFGFVTGTKPGAAAAVEIRRAAAAAKLCHRNP